MNRHLLEILFPILRDKAIYFLTLLIILFQGIIQLYLETPLFDINLYRKPFLITIVISFIAYVISYLIYLIATLDKRPLTKLLSLIAKPFIHWPESLNFILLSLSIALILSIYTSIKSFLPEIVPFYLDPVLVEIDKTLFFGVHPWEITHMLFPDALTSSLISLMYSIWFFVISTFLIVCMIKVDLKEKRLQIILSFMLCWILIGNLSAIVFSSVGPCFYGLTYPGEDPYHELMTILNTQNERLEAQGSPFKIWSLFIQDLLWEHYSSDIRDIGSGISALPSMHVSITYLMSTSVYSINKKLGILSWIYTVIILIGSVHLGWHYAFDGFVAIFFTAAIWLLVKKLLGKAPSISRANALEFVPSGQKKAVIDHNR
ncbi:hypothetical protein MAQ5080_01482 [Marinomonas aquimarina]|uniref:Inositolphosphotransferase Aur1/Ipt1 domain-containing protein n=1 Tax=Marinomonas aquimarina TaxID=295068 RepID=A0A1A8TC04_9GAMM|nr:phosphatase PAP2 family protein [Marinomonas aquimarina]SBS29722.1 hypothetical protein MAQ5080_01482 [Marinomonas aquimarina]